MTTTATFALNILALTGDTDAAFAKAREDKGFNQSATKADWLAFARTALRNREATDRANEGYYA